MDTKRNISPKGGHPEDATFGSNRALAVCTFFHLKVPHPGLELPEIALRTFTDPYRA